MNPSGFSAPESEKYAKDLASNLGIDTINIPISQTYESFMQALEPIFAGTEWNVAEENLQSRIRGTMWMAISNKSEVTDLRRLVLSTGNKSEMATGYATLYGDMAGGFSALKDVPKTLVYELSEWRNSQSEAIPTEIIERPPSAELRPGQLDTDTLPPYAELDVIIEGYVEDDLSPEQIIAEGSDPDTVHRIVGMIDRAEYKRRQAPPGVKITEKAFGKDRRLPITNRYRPKP
jgi:NAD+ synthase (glutamine-hydrolysing)